MDTLSLLPTQTTAYYLSVVLDGHEVPLPPTFDTPYFDVEMAKQDLIKIINSLKECGIPLRVDERVLHFSGYSPRSDGKGHHIWHFGLVERKMIIPPYNTIYDEGHTT